MNKKNTMMILLFFIVLPLTTVHSKFKPKKAKPSASIKTAPKIKKALPELRGYIKMSGDEKKIPEFKIYYQGMETTNNSEGFFSFPLQEGKPKKISLIIGKKVSPEFEKTNTIKNLNVKENKRHQAFSLKQTTEGNFGSLSWEEVKLDNDNLSIDPDSVVVLVDPKYVDRLERWSTPLASGDVQLPKIILKNDNKKKLQRASRKSLLYSLDSKPFHENISKRTQNMKSGKGTMSLSW